MAFLSASRYSILSIMHGLRLGVQEWLIATIKLSTSWSAALAPPISSGTTITAVLAATKASKVRARNPKVMFILQSRFKERLSMVLLYENPLQGATGMRQ